MGAMITFSSFVSSLTNAMTRLRTINSEITNQHYLLRRYFSENNITTELNVRIATWAQSQTVKTKGRLKTKEINCLQILPTDMKGELLDQVYGPVLKMHPVFFQLDSHYPSSFRRIYPCIEELSLNQGIELYSQGGDAD